MTNNIKCFRESVHYAQNNHFNLGMCSEKKMSVERNGGVWYIICILMDYMWNRKRRKI